MLIDRPEPPETVENPVKIGGKAFSAAEEPEYECGGLIGVALIWFAAGMLVALALTVVIIT